MKKFTPIFLTLLMLFGFILEIRGEDNEEHGLGLKPLTDEQIQVMEEKWPSIVGVRTNKIGRLRINENLEQNSHAPLFALESSDNEENEFISVIGKNTEPTLRADSVIIQALPRSVNNALLPSFPPIGYQGPVGSCLAWASTYYQATHEIGLLNGYNNKASNQYVLSPKWTYNLLNEGNDGGLTMFDPYGLLAINGATSIANFPYDLNYRQWDTNPDHWISAISNRLKPAQMIDANPTPGNLDIIKQLLNNGHVFTFGTYINSWVFTKVGKDPSNPNSPNVGELAASWVQGRNGGHAMTIVGYNDDIWIDINGNGVVDPGEKGAFLVANSWGTGWGNQGFVWIAYDAFAAISSVPNGPSQNRVAAAEISNSKFISVVPHAANYLPKLIAQFTLSQSLRNQISISAGVSDTNMTTPSKIVLDYALNVQGGPYRFDGTNGSPQVGTFVLDLTDLVPLSVTTIPQRYYLTLTDMVMSNPTNLTAFALIDNLHKKRVDSTQVPLTADNSKINTYIDYAFQDSIPDGPPTVNISSPLTGAIIKDTVNVTVNATSSLGISRVDLYVDTTLYQSDTTSPYTFSINTTKLTNGEHQLMAIAYDTKSQMTTTQIKVNVQNVYNATYINSGGEDVNVNGITWKKDQFFTSGYTSTSNQTYITSIYKTERYGQFSYNIPALNGWNKVTLKFMETYFYSPNQRVFNVKINGNQVISNLDLIRTVGHGIPYDRDFFINVTNGNVKIEFIPVINWAKVNGISVVKTNQ